FSVSLPSSRIFLVAPRVRTTRGRGVFFSGLFLATTTLEVLWTDAVPNSAYGHAPLHTRCRGGALLTPVGARITKYSARPTWPVCTSTCERCQMRLMAMAMAACTTRQVNSCFAPSFAVGSSTLTIGHQHGRRLASQAD
ncbi:hypothetical protein JMJ77_0007748, partial [Colletotrichum scovillei]